MDRVPVPGAKPLDGAWLLECGCVFGTVEVDKAFVFRPCSTKCRWFEWAQAEFAKNPGKPVEFRYRG